jgi:hypothetical protein
MAQCANIDSGVINRSYEFWRKRKVARAASRRHALYPGKEPRLRLDRPTIRYAGLGADSFGSLCG